MNNGQRLLAGSLLLALAGATMLALGLTAPANSPEQGVTVQPRIATVRMGDGDVHRPGHRRSRTD